MPLQPGSKVRTPTDKVIESSISKLFGALLYIIPEHLHKSALESY